MLLFEDCIVFCLFCLFYIFFFCYLPMGGYLFIAIVTVWFFSVFFFLSLSFWVCFYGFPLFLLVQYLDQNQKHKQTPKKIKSNQIKSNQTKPKKSVSQFTPSFLAQSWYPS